MAQATNTKKKATTPGTPRRRHHEILETSARVFHEKGYQATSIQDIADEVGILKGSLYYYISSKEDLLYEIIHEVHQQALRVIDEVDKVDGDPLQKIRAFAFLHVTFNIENRLWVGVFFNDFRSLSEERRAVIVKERDEYGRYLRGLIRLGQEEGVVCPDVDPKLISLAILDMLNFIFHWYRPGGERSAAAVAQAYADFVVAGLACSPATHVPGHRAELAAVVRDGVDVGAGANGRKRPRSSRRPS